MPGKEEMRAHEAAHQLQRVAESDSAWRLDTSGGVGGLGFGGVEGCKAGVGGCNLGSFWFNFILFKLLGFVAHVFWA